MRNGRRLPQAKALAELPALTIEKIGEAPPKPWPAGNRPLAGIRVLDLSRVIAGPVAGRTLAVHGADVMLDLRSRPAGDPLAHHRYRPRQAFDVHRTEERAGARHAARALGGGRYLLARLSPAAPIASLGFTPEDAAKISPGIVYVSLSAYGHAGPWAERRGFDSLVQTSTGFNHAEGAGGRHRRAEGIAGADARPCHRLPDGVRRDDGEGAPVARGRQLACPRLAGADRPLALESRPRRGRLEDRGPEGRTRSRPSSKTMPSGFGPLQAVSHAAKLSKTPGVLGAAGGAARQAQGGMAGKVAHHPDLKDRVSARRCAYEPARDLSRLDITFRPPAGLRLDFWRCDEANMSVAPASSRKRGPML